jgi:hypothetical protein
MNAWNPCNSATRGDNSQDTYGMADLDFPFSINGANEKGKGYSGVSTTIFSHI